MRNPSLPSRAKGCPTSIGEAGVELLSLGKSESGVKEPRRWHRSNAGSLRGDSTMLPTKPEDTLSGALSSYVAYVPPRHDEEQIEKVITLALAAMLDAVRRRAAAAQLPRSLSLMTFNVLAPCYFRHGGRLESDDRTAYLSRAQALIHTIQRDQCDLICLQEYWFNPEYQAQFRHAFRGSHYIHTVKRPDKKEDGLAMFVAKHKFDIHHVHHIAFDKAGDRVALMMHVATKWNRHELPLHQRSFLLINSHLTFPHCEIYKEMRLDQINLVLDSIRKYVASEKLEHAPVLMCGDFNDFNDPVHNTVMDHGFSSVFSHIHGREARITHCNHNNREVGVDFIFASHLEGNEKGEEALALERERLQLLPTRCDLWPRNMSDRTRLKRPSFGHNWETLLSPKGPHHEEEAQFVDYWKLVSDHRPLVAAFDVFPPTESQAVELSELLL
ncbi:hypothetical protein Poli38472_012160 [Pythium oligandrum]|uniref:Endonuclease/exonuclease/phosphatase domain-containing protein n=1 Tax=Pythium oligandrum TaxID=41045 RepID=A0A8K1CP54_PYTOL|nr:hypothetical protein Poli38472_012160 [Pythium oligandrum]|eukprot:TMW67044.1 hypothetical protein Poli38472_012160 [Pythium oligandrum]